MSKRIIRLLRTFALMRICYEANPCWADIQSVLPCQPRCTVSLPSLIKRVKYLFELSIRDKALATLQSAHVPIFMNQSQLTMKLMMTRSVPPLPVPGALPGFPHPILDYYNKFIIDIMQLGSRLGEHQLKDTSFEEVSSWLDAMEILPAS